ncbi:peptidylprolyl isomerase [Lutibacter sp.]|uniref:peptidylprolyl isomerase n=1 Tax=Lutibacter sp. TaxID=1925666 RepID=UPI0025BE5026|nr:peptidylprolyl isomerase [Lutibacter sp.]MCF6181870.1 peptidylprolyl isomerase [Lutibacter sp.]
MKFLKICIVFLFALKGFSQESNHVLFTINAKPYYTQEFINTYKKNLQVTKSNNENIKDYLKLFIDYKLKIIEAKSLGLDTIQKFKNEVQQYKNQLIIPYLKNDSLTQQLVKEAYNRLTKEVNVSHILIFLKQGAKPKDTLIAYNKLLAAKKLILGGQKFEDVAKKVSQDPTVKQNGGKIGYFTVFQMVYPFENQAYKTPLNKVSMPFRTKFGYHIIKVNGIRNNRGEVEVAHIMIKNNTLNAKQKIDSIYDILLNNKVSFYNLAKKVSDDKASAVNGGRLRKFGAGKMIESFSNVAFSLNKANDISKPFKTKYGWHIIKLIKKYPIESFKNLKPKLTDQVKRNSRFSVVNKTLYNKLNKLFKVVVDSVALNQFSVDNYKTHPENFDKELLSIGQKKYSQKDFGMFLNRQNRKNISVVFNKFKQSKLLNYYKNYIENTNSDFIKMFSEFKDGMLLFDLLENKVWNKSKDSIGLVKFYNHWKTKKYQNTNLETHKGIIISDYQNYLEKQLIKKLHSKYKIEINKKEEKRILKSNI